MNRLLAHNHYVCMYSIPTRLVNSCCGARGGLGDRAACRRSLRRGSAGHREKPTHQFKSKQSFNSFKNRKNQIFRFFWSLWVVLKIERQKLDAIKTAQASRNLLSKVTDKMEWQGARAERNCEENRGFSWIFSGLCRISVSYTWVSFWLWNR